MKQIINSLLILAVFSTAFSQQIINNEKIYASVLPAKMEKEGIIVELSDKNYYLCKKLDKYGIISKNYSTIVPFEYDKISNLFTTKDSVVIATINKKSFLINNKNIRISAGYDEIVKADNIDLFKVNQDKKSTFIDSKGNQFQDWYENNLYINSYYSDVSKQIEYCCIVSKNNKFGLIDKTGQLILSIIYDEIKSLIIKNKVIVKMGKYGLIDLKSKIIVPFEYDDIDFTNSENNQEELIVKIDSKFGLINYKNLKIINTIYDGLYESNQGFRIAKKGNLFGLIDKLGNEIIPFDYSKLRKIQNKERVMVCKDDLCGIVDLKNRIIIPFEYIEISKHSFDENNEYSKSDHIYKVYKEGKTFIVDENNIIIKK